MALPARHEKRYTRGCIAQHRGQLQPPINTKTQRHQDTKKAAGSAQRPSCLWYVQFGGPASMKDVVIISAVRTPIGKFQGALKSITAPQLGSIVVRNAVERAGLPRIKSTKSSWAMWSQRALARIPRARQRCAEAYCRMLPQ